MYAVLGGTGLMGRIVVRDLVESGKHVRILGIDQEKIKNAVRYYKNRRVEGGFADARDIVSMRSAFKDVDVVVNAVQYELNMNVMNAALAAGVHYLDLGGLFHMTRKQLALHKAFKKQSKLALLGMGAAPGITNVLAAKACSLLDRVDAIRIQVGGKDFTKTNGFSFSYSIRTILEEHMLSPMVFENGRFVAKPPRSGKEWFDFPKPIGRVFGMLTLHSEVATLPLSFRFKGLRHCSFKIAFPEEFERALELFIQTGLASQEAVHFNGQRIVPLDFLTFVLNRLPKSVGNPNDVELLRAKVEGRLDGKKTTVHADCWAHPIRRWCASAGDVDTGVPPSIAAQMIESSLVDAAGVLPPEKVIPFDPFVRELAKRRISVKVVL